MFITVNKKELLRAVKGFNEVVEKKGYRAILQCINFKVVEENNALILTGTDSYKLLKYELKCDSILNDEKMQSFNVNAKQLLETLKLVSGELITLEVNNTYMNIDKLHCVSINTTQEYPRTENLIPNYDKEEKHEVIFEIDNLIAELKALKSLDHKKVKMILSKKSSLKTVVLECEKTTGLVLPLAR